MESFGFDIVDGIPQPVLALLAVTAVFILASLIAVFTRGRRRD